MKAIKSGSRMESSSSASQVGRRANWPIAIEETQGNTSGFSAVQVLCRHGIAAQVKTSWTANNPGRRFAICPIQVVNDKCNFFDWVDPEWDDRSFSALTKLMQKKDNAVQEGNSWKEEAEKLIGTNIRLTEELAEMKEELEKERAKADRGIGRDGNMQLRDELKELKMDLKKQKEAFNGVVKLVVGAMAFALVVLVVAMVLKV